MRDTDTAEQIAERFHEAYERLAAQHGYLTRKESSVPWPEVPERNKDLMVAVVTEVVLPRLVEAAERTAELELSLATYKSALSGTQSVRDDYKARMQAAEQWAKTMEHERDYEQQVVTVDLSQRLEAAEAERDAALQRAAELETALTVYVDHRNWGITRDEFRHPSAIWIGPGATHTPVPDAPGVARAALGGPATKEQP